MKRVTQILTIVAAGILLLSTLALLICIVFQTPLMQLQYGEDLFYAHEGFSIPFDYLFMMFVLGLTAVALIFTVCNEKIGTWTEIVGAGLIAAGIPVITNVVYIAQNFLVGRYFSATTLTRQNLVSALCSNSLSFVDFATGLLLIACGISIAYKYMTRKAAKESICE